MPTLDEQLAEFRRRIDKLEDQAKKASGALQLAPHQVGPRPGWFRAARIEGTQMVIDLSASQTGTSPLISVTDTAGVRRVEMGNLAANGISPAQYGLRANSASGTPFFDSLGLIEVMKFQGTSIMAGGSLAGTGAGVALGDGTFNLSLVQQSAVVFFAMLNGKVSATGTTCLIDLSLDGGLGASITNGLAVSIDQLTFGSAFLVGITSSALAAGAHTVDFRATVAIGTTLTWDGNGGIMAFSLGRNA